MDQHLLSTKSKTCVDSVLIYKSVMADLSQGCTVHLILELRGGGTGPPPEMAVAAGGKIKQEIVVDNLGELWQSGRTTVFNVQILNSILYRSVTGEDPPTKPIDAKTYKQHGFPFFKISEEPSGISGNFSMVKSVGQIDGKKDENITPKVVEIGTQAAQVSVGLTNPNGPLREFRTVGDLNMEHKGRHFATF